MTEQSNHPTAADGEPDADPAFRDRWIDLRRRLGRQLTPVPFASSTDGRGFAYQMPVVDALPVGGFAALRPDDGTTLLGQVTAAEVVEREGPALRIAGSAGLTIDPEAAEVTETSIRLSVPALRGVGTLLAVAAGDRWREPGPGDVFDSALTSAADPATVAAWLDRWAAARPTLDVGRLTAAGASPSAGAGGSRRSGIRARVAAAGFGRHTFLCGQSGSGKSYTLGVILERLLVETRLRLVVLDPNGDYVRLGALLPPDRLHSAAGEPLPKPDYEALRRRHADAVADLHVLRAPAQATDEGSAIRLRFSELAREVQATVLRLDPIADREETHAFRRIVDDFGPAPYGLAEVRAAAAADLSPEARQVALRIDNLGVADWSLWAGADAPGLGDRLPADWRAVVLDTGGFTHAQESALVANGVLSVLWQRRADREPVLIVIDEAHNVCPAEPGDPIQAAATARVVQIAGEGRKFGRYLLVATQRPQKVHPNVVSQADNLVLMRMNAAADLDRLRETFSFVPPAMLELAARFRLGKTLLAGPIVPTPLLARIEGRFTAEGGGDVPSSWTTQ
jgi:hypothetical protein